MCTRNRNEIRDQMQRRKRAREAQICALPIGRQGAGGGVDRRRRRRYRSLRRVQPQKGLQGLSLRTGARLQNASGVVDQRANRRAFVRLDRKRDARLAQGVLHMASGSTRLCVANQVFWRGIFQHAWLSRPGRKTWAMSWQRVESSDRAPVQTVRDARRCSRHARCHS
jgi:hypothetical protein